MKIKVVIVLLAVASVGLAIALFSIKKLADDRHAADINALNDISNQVADAKDRLKESSQVNLSLSNELASSQQQVALGTDQMAQLSNNLASANTTLADTRSSLASEEETVTNLNHRVADLEAQNRALDEQAESLSNALAQVVVQIEKTKDQLALARTNSAFLQGELQKQLAQKAELEHRFNDLDELRSQVKKLKDELWAARRVEFTKYDIGNKKGAELLKMLNARPAGAASGTQAATNYGLNVEIGSDRSVKVLPPPGSTNKAAQ